MKKINMVVFFGWILIGCGGSTTSGNSEDSRKDIVDRSIHKKFVVAKDNSFHDVNRSFNGLDVVVYTDKVLSERVSNSTKAIYGKLNGKNTASLLSINNYYGNNDKFIIKVFSKKRLVGESELIQLDGNILDFGSISLYKGGE